MLGVHSDPRTTASTIAANNFSRVVDEEMVRRLFVEVYGREGDGKTHFAIATAPRPVIVLSFDMGIKDIIARVPDNKDIYHRSYYVPDPEMSDKQTKNLMDSFLKDWMWVVNAGLPQGTLVVDTVTEVKQVIEKAKLAEIAATRKSGEVYPFDYGHVNAFWLNMLKTLHGTNLSAIFLAKASEKWEGKTKTGEFEAQDHKSIPYFVSIKGRIKHEKNELTGEWKRTFTLDKCRQQPEHVGLAYEGPMCTFDTLLNVYGPAPLENVPIPEGM